MNLLEDVYMCIYGLKSPVQIYKSFHASIQLHLAVHNALQQLQQLQIAEHLYAIFGRVLDHWQWSDIVCI